MIKRITSLAASLPDSRCRYDQALFVLGHMRCGSTVLSHILCDHPAVSGYGEAHIRYDGRSALGTLVLNQLRRGALKNSARHLFDKILHSRYDADPAPEFYTARAIFLIREPEQSVLSIRKLFTTIGSGEYATDGLAADYYEERLTALLRHWDSFAPERRIGFSFEALTSAPEAALAAVSERLGFTPPLSNRYTPPKRTMAHGAGDPLASHKHTEIVATERATTLKGASRPLELSSARMDALVALYRNASNVVMRPK